MKRTRHVYKRDVQAIITKRIEEKKLFEQRKQLFNAYPIKKSGGGLDQRATKLFRQNLADGSLSSEVQRLIINILENTPKIKD